MDALTTLNFTEAGRVLQTDSPLGKDAFLTETFLCRQYVNRLDEAKLMLRANRDDVKAEDIVGKEITVLLSYGVGLGWRKFNYLVTGLSAGARLTRGFRHYELTLRPTLWLMSQKSDCRIYLNKTVTQIAEMLCDEHGIRGLDMSRVFDLPPAQDYTVQWMETDLDFLMRMFQKYGIFFWTRQDDGKQVLVLANKPVGYDNGADGDKGQARIATGSTDCNHISEWRTDYQFVPGKHAGRDWNFEDPNRVQSSDVPSTVKLPRNGSYEFYQYPALAMSGREAEKQITNRAQASEAGHQTIVGESDLRNLEPGAKVTPFDLANPQNSYETAIIMSIEHKAANPTFEATEGDAQPDYSNSFTCLSASSPATPERTIPRPRIDGMQIAIIAGPSGEEIHCDRYGRVKLKHLWDRRAKGDGTDTKWIRVGQPWAGSSWGHRVNPRVGMEVLVAYEDGDPDRPFVIGTVANPNTMVPNTLPAFKTRMVMQSKTYKGQGENILRWEDATDQQEFFMQAEKFMNVLVKDNETQEIKGHRHKRVDKNQSEDIGLNKDIKVGENHREFITMTMSLTVGMARQTTIGLADSLSVGAERSESIGKQLTQFVGEAMRTTVGSNQHIQTGLSVYIDSGKNVVIDAAHAICFNVKGNFIRIDESGITLRTVGDNPINLNCSGAHPVKGTPVDPISPLPALPYIGPAAVRYPRSYEK